MINYTTITERHEKIIILGSGESLIDFNFSLLYNINDAFIITVNDSGNFLPLANAWFTLDPWGLATTQIPNKFMGKLFAAVPSDFGTPTAKSYHHRQMPNRDISYLKRILKPGLSDVPDTIHTGNSGYGAFGLAYHMNPECILLLGIDASTGYFYRGKKLNRDLSHLPKLFQDTIPQLRDKMITVINGSPNSNVVCFPRYTPEYALEKFMGY